jgi:putative ABC transport system permease protein
MKDFMTDDNYIKNISLKFAAGHNFNASEQIGREKHVILNETAVDRLGFKYPADAIGHTIYADDSLALQIIGVVKDFHFRPMNNLIGPLALRYNPDKLNYLSVKIHPLKKVSVIASVNSIWKKYDPIHPVRLIMMEEEIDDAYRQTGMSDMPMLVGYVAFLIISLACLGLTGMTMYASQTRTKEVGIRKVMGATVTQIVMLLGKSYMMLIAVAVIIGVPVSFILAGIFLEEYPYRIQITPLLLAFSIAVITLLGLLTAWSQTIKVAVSNPVKWLRQQ